MQIRSYRHVKKFIRTWLNDAGFMTRVTCRLTAKSQDQLRNLTLGNRVWATFFLPERCTKIVPQIVGVKNLV